MLGSLSLSLSLFIFFNQAVSFGLPCSMTKKSFYLFFFIIFFVRGTENHWRSLLVSTEIWTKFFMEEANEVVLSIFFKMFREY